MTHTPQRFPRSRRSGRLGGRNPALPATLRPPAARGAAGALRLTLLALGLGLCSLAQAKDDSTEQHFTIRAAAPQWIRTISVKRHDPERRGSHLTQVDIRLTATITGTIVVQNQDPQPQSISVSYNTTVSVLRPDRSPLAQVTPTYASSQALASGASVTLTDVSGTGAVETTTTAPRDLTFFSGSGSVNVRVEAIEEVLEALGHGEKIDPVSSLADPLVTAEIWITYHTVDAAIFDLYRAYIQTFESTTIVDTCRARSIGEARAVFESRHPGLRIVTTQYVRDAVAAGYWLYLGGLRTADRQNIEDSCWALSHPEARRILRDRHPGAVVNHLGLYPANRDPVTWHAVVKRATQFERVEAFQVREALSVFAKRYPRDWIVRVVQCSNENEYRAFEGILDPSEFIEIVEATSPSAAAQAALAGYPQHQVLDVQFSRSGDDVEPYEGTVSLAKGGTAIDTCPASSPGEARRILSDRHGGATVANLHPRGQDPLYTLYESTISVPGKGNVTDIACARTPVQARAILAASYPTGNAGGVNKVTAMEKVGTFRAQISTADGRNVIDTCWAVGSAAARKVFLARFPDGGVRSMSPFGSNRPDEYEVTLKGMYRKDRCEARDKAEAMRILQQRFPDYNVVSVHDLEVIPEEAVYRAQINTRDHQNIVDTVQAKSYGEARTLFLGRHPDSRLTSLHRVTEGRVKETFQAQLDLGSAEDTVQAESSAEATRILLGRYPRCSITGLHVAIP